MNHIKVSTKNNKNKKEMKKNRVVNYPSNTFTIDELAETNKHFIPITLRSRLTKAIDQGKVIKIGTLVKKMGRPKMLLARAPITDDHIKEANEKDVTFNENLRIQVMNVLNSVNDNVPQETVIEEQSNELSGTQQNYEDVDVCAVTD